MINVNANHEQDLHGHALTHVIFGFSVQIKVAEGDDMVKHYHNIKFIKEF